MLKALFENADKVYVIHYSCESFYGENRTGSPRITSLAVRSLSTGQTESFSIHHEMELEHVEFSKIENRYNELERQMLDRFFGYLKRQSDAEYLHWNMRDANYGFQAIEHRYKALGGDPFRIDSSKKFDLARLFKGIYGPEYVQHPRMINLLKKNNIRSKDLLTGKQEAEAFNRKEYIRLHQSTLRKVDIIADFAERSIGRNLRTDSNSWHTLKSIGIDFMNMIKDHWVFSIG